jgi:hypothetical protein
MQLPDYQKISTHGIMEMTTLTVTSGQLEYEWTHLMTKLKARDPALYQKWEKTEKPETHPLFRECAGDIESWERR